MRKPLCRLSFIVLTLLICTACKSQQREDWLGRSALVFKGEVLLLRTSTINHERPVDLGVVKVVEIYSGNELLDKFLSEPVTVKFLKPGEIKKGQQLIFYANPWMEGESIAVTEIAHEAATNNFNEQIKSLQLQVEQKNIQQQISRTELIFAGTIATVKKIDTVSSFDSEHNPEWVLAEIKVDESLKGEARTGSTIVIAFPGSQDVMWYKSPRFAIGHRGVWFLTKNVEGNNVIRQFTQYTVTRQDQFQGIENLDKIKQALR